MLQSSLKSYQRQITHDGIYAVATLMAADTVQEDDRSGKHEKDEDTNLVDTEQMELQPRRCYIFCPARDQKRLFEELDHKTAAPLIPEFQDYVLSSLRQRGDLRQLEVISLRERIDAWVLDLKPQDQNVVEVLEQGLQSGAIQIPGTLPGIPDGFENVENVTGYEEPTELVFGNPTVITGGNGRGKSSIADAIAFAVTGCPFFGERGIDRLHNENNPDVAIRMCFVDETGTLHELNRTRRKNRMTITYDGYEIRQLDLADLFGERDVFLSIFNPLYFIEELGEDGKKLLERYLPTIPHETVLSQLSEPVREHLKNETILSPEGSLKRCREEIRGLEERITYLRGQKDLAASQGESHEQAEQEVTLQADLLRREIAELEQRQFSSMDVSAMQERLVELSGRYEEAARDERADTSKLREQLQLLREKIARREGEQYQSKFTEALAEASARVKDLGVRYQRESAAYKAFHAGMECPACHRSVTEQSLPEVQAALKKVLSELYAAGSERRAQLIELQEMDKKAADTFAQFKEDDLGKWAAEAAEMEQRCASLAEQASAETERLRAEIQTLTADLE